MPKATTGVTRPREARRRLALRTSIVSGSRPHLPLSSPPSPYRNLDLCCIEI
jgi:hypothetical protein